MSVTVLNCVSDAEVPAGAEPVTLDVVLTGRADQPLVAYVPAPGWPREVELAAAIRALPRVILVRDGHWDGFTPDPLASAAGGIISGFGAAGVAAAVAHLAQGSG